MPYRFQLKFMVSDFSDITSNEPIFVGLVESGNVSIPLLHEAGSDSKPQYTVADALYRQYLGPTAVGGLETVTGFYWPGGSYFGTQNIDPEKSYQVVLVYPSTANQRDIKMDYLRILPGGSYGVDIFFTASGGIFQSAMIPQSFIWGALGYVPPVPVKKKSTSMGCLLSQQAQCLYYARL